MKPAEQPASSHRSLSLRKCLARQIQLAFANGSPFAAASAATRKETIEQVEKKEEREKKSWNWRFLLARAADAVAVYQPWTAVTGSIAARRVRGGLVAELWEALKSKGIGG